MIGFGAQLGFAGTRRGIGAITPIGGTLGLVCTIGHIGTTAITSTTIIMVAVSTMLVRRVLPVVRCVTRYAVTIMPRLIPDNRSVSAMSI